MYECQGKDNIHRQNTEVPLAKMGKKEENGFCEVHEESWEFHSGTWHVWGCSQAWALGHALWWSTLSIYEDVGRAGLAALKAALTGTAPLEWSLNHQFCYRILKSTAQHWWQLAVFISSASHLENKQQLPTRGVHGGLFTCSFHPSPQINVLIKYEMFKKKRGQAEDKTTWL